MTELKSEPEFDRWCETRHSEVTASPAWRLRCYREALFALNRAQADARLLWERPPFGATAGQLVRAVGSVAANLAEGYSRPTGPDRARFLVFSASSLRESVVWYDSARSTLGDALVDERLDSLGRIRHMLLALLARSPSAPRYAKWR